MQAVADNKCAAVIVEEGHQVHAPILPLQYERKQIGLPQLVWLGTLETADVIWMRPGRLLHLCIARFPQHPGHGIRTGRQRRPRESSDRLILRQPQSGWACLSKRMVRLVSSGSLLPQDHPAADPLRPAGPSASKLLLPAIEGEPGDADQGCEVTSGQAAALPRCPGMSRRCLAVGGSGAVCRRGGFGDQSPAAAWGLQAGELLSLVRRLGRLGLRVRAAASGGPGADSAPGVVRDRGRAVAVEPTRNRAAGGSGGAVAPSRSSPARTRAAWGPDRRVARAVRARGQGWVVGRT